MFNVINKNTGETITVYHINGTHFLLWNAEDKHWYYDEMDNYEPVLN